MAKYTEASCRICRREGTKLFLKGDRCTSKKCACERRPSPPGQHGLGRRKASEYGLQLREKQKVCKAYGLMEKQFHRYYEEADRMRGVTGEIMLSLLERRLDNVVYKMGIASSLKEARQIVNHAHIEVNGKCINIPSYRVNLNDTIGIKESKRDNTFFKELKGVSVNCPKWLSFDTESLTGKVMSLPKRDDIAHIFNEQLIIELYSK